MQRGLRKLFSNLSIAARKADDRKIAREKLHGYLRKIKIVSSRSSKQSVIHEEIKKLEKHLAKLLDQKLSMRFPATDEEVKTLKNVHAKEEELTEKIKKLNELLAHLGKKVNEKQFVKELGPERNPTEIEKFEDKLYALEAKYHEVEDKYPAESLAKLKDKISNLKEKIREIKTKDL